MGHTDFRSLRIPKALESIKVAFYQLTGDYGILSLLNQQDRDFFVVSFDMYGFCMAILGVYTVLFSYCIHSYTFL